jgi:hypothetical protein
MFDLDDTSESEVALDSLGSFFNYLINIDYSQDDTGSSQAVEEEVTIIPSGSAHLPRQKIRRVTRKVRFSHPLAHLDPHFLLKQQQHKNRDKLGPAEVKSYPPAYHILQLRGNIETRSFQI